MRPSEALDAHRDAIRTIVKRYGTRNPRVFGSILRHMDVDGSDLDLLIDPLPGTTLFDLGGLQVELEELLQVRVDVLTPGDLPLRFRSKVIKEAVSV